MFEIRRDDNMSRTWNTRIELSLVPCIINHWLNTKLPLHCPLMLGGLGYKVELILFPLTCETHGQFDNNLSNNWNCLWFLIVLKSCLKCHITSDYLVFFWIHYITDFILITFLTMITPTSLRFLCRDAREFSLAWWHRKRVWKTIGVI